MNTVLVVGILITGMSLLFAIIATATPFWWRLSSDRWEESMNYGLFQVCRYTISDEVCRSYDLISGWLSAVQAMMIMCILALVASLGLSVLFAFIVKDKTILALGAAFMEMAAAFLGLVAIIIYGAKMSDNENAFHVLSVLKGGLHASYGLAVVAVIFAMVAPVLIFFSRNSNT